MKIDDVIQQPGHLEWMQQSSILRSGHTSVVGSIVKYDPNKRTVDVQPMVRGKTKENPPLLMDVPVWFPGSFTYNVNVGDECLVVFADNCIDAWWQSGTVSSPITARSHDMSDGIAIVGLKSLPNITEGTNLNDILKPFTGATSLKAGEMGLVPKPNISDRNKYLKGDGTWHTVEGGGGGGIPFIGATETTDGEEGIVPAPLAGEQNKVLMGCGTWENAPKEIHEYASKNAFPSTGSAEELYIEKDSNEIFRWDSTSSSYMSVGGGGGGGGGDGLKPVDFSIATTDWTQITGGYSATVGDSYISGDSEEIVLFSESINTYLESNIRYEKTAASHLITFYVSEMPTGTITGRLLIIGPGVETAFEDFQGATPSSNGYHGLVPAPLIEDRAKFLKGDGTWGNVPNPQIMTGATSSVDGTSGLVPAPSAGQQTLVLTGGGGWQESPGAKVYVAELQVTNTSGSYTQTVQDENLTASMKAVELEVSRPYVFGDVITVTPANGSYTVSCANVSGTDTIKISFLKVIADPTAVTSTEFDILNNRISAIENTEALYSVTIQTTDWSASPYTYTWSNSDVTADCSVEIGFLDGAEDCDVDFLEWEKATGSITFSVETLPSVALPIVIKLTNARAKYVENLTADMVATDAVTGASNVDEALTALDGKFSQYSKINAKYYQMTAASDNVSFTTLGIANGHLLSAMVVDAAYIICVPYCYNNVSYQYIGFFNLSNMTRVSGQYKILLTYFE